LKVSISEQRKLVFVEKLPAKFTKKNEIIEFKTIESFILNEEIAQKLDAQWIKT
jgi:hypothetical protein